MEKREESRFIKGLICGVLLTLVCMAGWTAVYRINMNRRIEQMRTGMESGSDETAGENKEQPAEQSDELQISGDAVLAKISELQNIINSVYRGEIDSDQVEEYIYVGLVAGLQDPYSEYFPKQERKQFEEETTGAYTGIGGI